MSDLATRYGSPSRARRGVVIAGVSVFAVVALTWLAWAAIFHGRPDVRSAMVGFSLNGQHAVGAEFVVVRRDTGVASSCLLQALASDHSIVGEQRLPVAAATQSSQLQRTVRTSFRTERRATSVDLVGCTAPGQHEPR